MSTPPSPLSFHKGCGGGNYVKFMRQILVKYIYIYIKFLMYKVLLWQLKLVSTISIFAIKIKILKNYQRCVLFYQIVVPNPNFQIFVLPSSSFFSFLGHCWFYRRSWLGHHYVTIMLSLCYHYKLSLSWILSKVLILMLGQLIEYYTEKIIEELLTQC